MLWFSLYVRALVLSLWLGILSVVNRFGVIQARFMEYIDPSQTKGALVWYKLNKAKVNVFKSIIG